MQKKTTNRIELLLLVLIYHSKYNPIESVWGVLERHWNGEILDSVEKVLGLCRTLTWKGKAPAVMMENRAYKKGVKFKKRAMLEL